MTREPALVARDLTKTYGRGEGAVRAVDRVSFEVDSGTVVGLLGPNGAGKTTTIEMMLGLVIPTEGRVRIDGIDVHAESKAAYRRVSAMLEGTRNTYWRLTVRENLDFSARLGGVDPTAARERHDRLLRQLALVERADETVNELSRGMKQKVALACTLARETPIVFLDEPTLGLDVESSLELRAELRRLVDDDGLTVVVSSHDMDVIEDLCDRVIIMNRGRVVVDDTVESLLALFRTQTYAIRLIGRVSGTARRHLRTEFGVDDFERRGGGEQFHARVIGDEFYALADVLRDAGVTVASIEAVEPDLEEVFLHVTGDDHGGERA